MESSDSAFENTAAARTPGRDVLGKLDDHMPEVRVPGQVRHDAERAAREDGLDLTAWCRELYYAALYGPTHVASLYEARARRVLGNAGHRDPVALPVRDEMRPE